MLSYGEMCKSTSLPLFYRDHDLYFIPNSYRMSMESAKNVNESKSARDFPVSSTNVDELQGTADIAVSRILQTVEKPKNVNDLLSAMDFPRDSVRQGLHPDLLDLPLTSESLHLLKNKEKIACERAYLSRDGENAKETWNQLKAIKTITELLRIHLGEPLEDKWDPNVTIEGIMGRNCTFDRWSF